MIWLLIYDIAGVLVFGFFLIFMSVLSAAGEPNRFVPASLAYFLKIIINVCSGAVYVAWFAAFILLLVGFIAKLFKKTSYKKILLSGIISVFIFIISLTLLTISTDISYAFFWFKGALKDLFTFILWASLFILCTVIAFNKIKNLPTS